MKRRKEKILIEAKTNGSDFLWKEIFVLKQQKLFEKYEVLKSILAKQKKDGGNYERTLNKIKKTGNALKLLKTLTREIIESYARLDTMITIVINDKEIFRLSEAADRRRSHTKKIVYGHKETAMQAAKEVSARTGDDLEHYKCRHCDGWHIGHSV